MPNPIHLSAAEYESASNLILPHADVLPPVFYGKLQRLKLCSDGAFKWGNAGNRFHADFLKNYIDFKGKTVGVRSE